MVSNIFVNLPVKDLERSKAFFAALGFTFNPQFTDEKAACMVIGENMFAMLLTEAFFQTFTKKVLVDAQKSTEVLIALSVGSRSAVEEIRDKALAAGASEARETQDHGFMFVCAFNDLDGHIWEVLWMDTSIIQTDAN
jgi:uncharacterized protein